MDNLITSTKTASGNLGIKLGALFVLVFGGIVVGYFALDLFSAMSARSEQSVRPEEVTVIDPKIEADLKKVLEFTGLPTDVDVRDPFKDRADLSGEMAKIDQGAAQSAAPSVGNQPGSATTQGGEAKPVAAPDPVAETKARFEAREDRIKLGLNAGVESEVFAVDDLLPVGVVGGGAGRQEVLVYSRALKRTFSFAVGSKLFDGWIAEVRSEGVAFVMDGRTRTTRIKIWSSSIKDISEMNPGFKRGTLVA